MRVFRAFFLLLVLANLGFFAWTKGYLGGQESGREPQRLASQIVPEKLRIVAAAPVVTAPAAPSPAWLACRVVTGLPLAEVEAFKAELVGFNVEVKPAEGTTSYWVHIPPQASKAAADKKAAELRALGIKDFYIMQDEGPSLNAISLGLFKNEAAAGELLQNMIKRGVRSARIEVRQTPARHTRVLVKGPSELLDRRLPGLVAKMPGAATTECP
ncbi:SPOR domain-containing protein [Sulfurisoma sediminicola]|uniref:Sporulation related protein n=1 Tax=Sulfurisoma sediminicola TaxID=1381557 RepID=A0A497XJ16_9PROT|nr:SPOR domain-containing protein [Sulfurisoma sediminicola]RLJ67903.1 sporulation related protein [Sulfurisoma sediminicola]